jgi:hypothetical protein
VRAKGRLRVVVLDSGSVKPQAELRPKSQCPDTRVGMLGSAGRDRREGPLAALPGLQATTGSAPNHTRAVPHRTALGQCRSFLGSYCLGLQGRGCAERSRSAA